jgi:spore coat polysaccharide biosynthesis protein SpsF
MREAGKTVAIIQARMSSSRFPGKVLEPLANRPMIVFMMERVQRAASIDEVCLATSEDPSDDALAATVEAAGFRVYRGSLNDVLDRFIGAARATKANTVLRLTGDCPLMDPRLVDDVVRALLEADADYCSNIDPPTFPDGLDIEVMRAEVLEVAALSATLPSDREHVTPFIRREKTKFKHTTYQCVTDLSALRWTVDYQDDLDTVTSIVAGLRGDPVEGDMFDCLRSAQRVADVGGLAHHARNEGYLKSLAADAASDQNSQ